MLDSDYVVSPDWLRCDGAAFRRSRRWASCSRRRTTATTTVAFFKRLMFWEYAGFFRLGMVTRNERNAIIQHGTMTLVRRSALEQAGGWAEWTITEDAELGLRLFRHGWQAVYVAAELRPRRDAGRLRRLSQAAFPLGLRRDADLPRPLAARCCRRSTATSRWASAGTSSPAGCPGSATRWGCCSC